MSTTNSLALRRLDFEETKCAADCSLLTERLDEQTLRISFNGPEHTQYSEKYVIRVIAADGYPFKPPKVYFEGNSPNHKFYHRDGDSYLTPKKTTNLANTDFGLFYGWWSPQCTVIHIVERILYSLTAEGENEMDDYMCSCR